jgi:GH24 family phage-related lysozyme (muramidase)
MKTSQRGINLIKKYEGCRLTAYKPVPTEKYWTIGYGHYGPDVQPGATITQYQADLYLLLDVEKFEKKVDKYNAKYMWTQNEFDALVSFAYNIGSIDQLTDNGKRTKQQIAAKIPAYNKAGGKVLAGLTKRRKEEQALLTEGLEDVPVSAMGVQQFSKSRDGKIQLSENFKVTEIACKDNSDKILIDVTFVKTHLQDIRTHFGKPVIVNSAYRTETYNRYVGGAKNSYHMKGRAFDISIKGVSPQEIAKYAASIGVPGIIQYNTFVHVDSRDTKYWARNDNGKVTKKSSF